MLHVPEYYEYCCRVKVVAGHDVLERIPAILERVHATRPMIVTDRGVAGAGLIDVMTEAMDDQVIIGGIEDDVPPDSSLEVVKRIAESYRNNGCDALIAVGGGSVLDTAKGVNIMVSEETDDPLAFSGVGTLKRRLKPMIAIPTTAGTGSETTMVAVIKDHKRRQKMFFLSYFLLPDVALIDSRMTLTLPPAITAATAMDALTHAMEAYTCLAKNPLSDSCALSAIELIIQNLMPVMKQPDYHDGRLGLAVAATMAGMAFSNAMVGMVHSLGHALGAVCGIPHGIAMAILLPYGLEYNLHRNGNLTAELLLPIEGADVYARTPHNQRAQIVIKRIRELNQSLHEITNGKHPRFLREIYDSNGNIAVPTDNFPDIITAAKNDGTLVINPEDLDGEDFKMVLENAWAGTPLDCTRIKRG
ncbi:MAG: iron-containing alcohol dehydrogenase [Deltaproteobacteria bacterium]|jgi:alcohol dehydrogenase|nr:iron-containing alcohol dehydrogenase [Deltaproteobacteria bacterium]